MNQLSNAEAERIVRSGVASLQQGRPWEAAAELTKVTASGRANVQIWLLLAHALRQAGDSEEEEKALDALLALEPTSVRALVMKGDRRAASGDPRAATGFYKRARALAAVAEEVPDDLRIDLGRIEKWLAETEAAFRDHLEGELTRRGVAAGSRSPRFQQSLDILSGLKRPYFQEPSDYFFPELPQRQFYEREEFAWARALEAETGAIRDELRPLIEERDGFRPYLVSNPQRPPSNFHGLVDNPEWSSLYLWDRGEPVAENVARCPRTFAGLNAVPLAHIGVRAPVVMFSWLRPGARIPAHNGAMNARLICHLPLIVPAGCGFRVGNEVREWEEGRLLIFDDTIEHEAWNDSERDRVVLIFDVWRPELSEEERKGVAALFEAIDGYADTGAAG
ncbi:MAG TPA: aspartyl/asparaginyl beta-hydroxylase domain-containing protein [Allosphingosinicella sp.]|nr:aspartyl/asparaginyl beta-hydroxylase domain-containing protein [Allosphingosinicella sp.]